jgi:hypothetical protein
VKTRSLFKAAHARSARGLTIDCRGCGTLHSFGREESFARRSRTLTLVSLGFNKEELRHVVYTCRTD